MKHLIFCREYPPAPHPAGGIGTYAEHVARLLAEEGETVHVVAQLWQGAARRVDERHGGRLVVHRVPLDEPVEAGWPMDVPELAASALTAFRRSELPSASFGWQASLLAETLVEREAIDVVEAQDFEAPLYYFQLRRALGLGPARRPPCFVHLHSPTEYIFRYNGWDVGRPDYLPQKRVEDYSITAADALLCPSRYLARQIEAQFGLRAGDVSVVPYPIGDLGQLDRSPETWAGGTICFVGRLEPRKGVVEYLDAAIDVAPDHPALRFDFVGSDTSLSGQGGTMVGEYLRSRIPAALRARFRFHGAQPRERLPKLLAAACIAAVPSRWENFPNSCIEAMCSGLPVLASPAGGLVEMVEDGRTGWLAASGRREDLARALRRALATSPAEREAMGGAAAATVRQCCDNAAIVERQLEFRRNLVAAGPDRSLRLAPVLPWAGVRGDALQHRPSLERSAGADTKGLGLVVTAVDGIAPLLDDCLAAVARQTRVPTAVVLVADEACDDTTRVAVGHARAAGWRVVDRRGTSITAARNAGIRALLAGGTVPLGIACVDAGWRLHPAFVEACESTLRSCPEVGVVSSWTRPAGDADTAIIRPCPAFPYQWIMNDAATCSAVRTEAFAAARLFRAELPGAFAWWDLVNAVMATGWVAITYPAILSDEGSAGAPAGSSDTQWGRALLERFPDLVERDAGELAILRDALSRPVEATRVVAQVLTPRDVLRAPLAKKMLIARQALHDPGNALRWLVWHGRRTLERATSRVRRQPPGTP
jgi:glycogen(starch) synthase